MEEKKLIIAQKRFRGDSTVLSIRIPNDLLEKLDEIASKTGRTRNEIVQTCLEYAVTNLEIK